MSAIQPVAIINTAISNANPFAFIKPVTESATKVIIPYVDQISQQTTGLVVNDPPLAFYMTLLFMVSLIVVLLSDRVNMTRNLRVAMIETHMIFLRLVRGIVTVGLFMVGRRIGSASTFIGGLGEATPFIETTTTTWVLQKILEWFSQVNHNSVYNSQVFIPVITDGLLQSVCQVAYDYLQTYNTIVIQSLSGGRLSTLGANNSFPAAHMVSGDKTSSTSFGDVRTLLQAYAASAIPLVGGKLAGAQADDGTWYLSPLYVGVVVGML